MPSFSQLFNKKPEPCGEAERILLETGLEKSKESLRNTMSSINRKEFATVSEKLFPRDMSQPSFSYTIQSEPSLTKQVLLVFMLVHH